jgi:hypothetical protein
VSQKGADWNQQQKTNRKIEGIAKGIVIAVIVVF